MNGFQSCGIFLVIQIFLTISDLPVNSEKILFLTPIAFKSHKIVFEPLIRELGLRGHEVIVISPVKSSNMPDTVKELVPVTLEDITGPIKNWFEQRKGGKLSFLTAFNDTFIRNSCHQVYKDPSVKELLKNEKFDLLIVNGLLNSCVTGIIHHFGAPFILFTTMPAPQMVASRVGQFFPPSFIPSPFTSFTDRMTIKEKLINMAFQGIIKFSGYFYYVPLFEKLYREHLGEDTPGLLEIENKISMIFMNSHFTMTYPRPLLPDIIEVGGMHARPSKALPKDLDAFLSDSKDGFIYFSLGTIVRPTEMPEKARKALINVFSRLKQKVIWKWDKEMKDLPSNVKIASFLPQQDILGHPNIKVFITHGGLLSTQEAIYHGVPLLGFPIFADQDLNIGQAENAGFCLKMEILDFSEEELEEKIHRLLNEPSFKEKAVQLSKVFRDQPETPLERAVYWTEYIIRYKGAPHLRSAARDLNFFQYFSLDVLAFLSLVLLIILITLRLILRFIYRVICSSSKQTKDVKKIGNRKKNK